MNEYNITICNSKKDAYEYEITFIYNDSKIIFPLFYIKNIPDDLNFICYYLLYYENLYHEYYINLNKQDKYLSYQHDYNPGPKESIYKYYLDTIHTKLHHNFNTDSLYEIYKRGTKYKKGNTCKNVDILIAHAYDRIQMS